MRTNYIKAKIDNTQQKNKCKFCGDKEVTINRIISEWSKLAKRAYKTKHDWVERVVYAQTRSRPKK